LKVAEGIEDARERVEALEAIAIGMGKAGVQDEALWRDALEAAVWDAWYWAGALGAIAIGMGEAGVQDEALWQDALEAAVWIHAWWQAVALEAIAEGMGKAGVQDEALWQDALKVTEGIEWVEWRAGALIAIAEGMGKAGVQDEALWQDALKVAEGIGWARERARALIAIAVEMAKAGEVEGAVSIVERETAVRTKGLPSVLRALAERAKQGDGRSKEGFLRLLPLCGWSLEFAYEACRLLHQLYPERGEEIAGVIAATGD
jgi:hypothetical protein